MTVPNLHGLLFVVLLVSIVEPLRAQRSSTGFAEDFALAADRRQAISRLIPGTVEFYFHSCLERQHAGAFQEVDTLLGAWVQRFGRSPQVEEIENRQALLTYGVHPEATYRQLAQRLGLTFDHQPESRTGQPDLPSRVDPAAISFEAFRRQAMARHPSSLDGFRESGLAAMAATTLDESLLASLLRRLERPDVPGLSALIVRDLDRRDGPAFGSLSIHNRLLLSQLDECARLRPELLRSDNFIACYLPRLQPSEARDWRREPALRQEYLERLEAFSRRLPAAQNSLKAHVLHHRLAHDLAVGQPQKSRLLDYLRLPRRSRWASETWLKANSGQALVDTGRAFPTGLGPIQDDTALVRAYFDHFLPSEDSIEPYTEFLSREFLTRTLAETKILAGVGPMERWVALLNDASALEEIENRVEIEFARTRREVFPVEDKVALDVDLKNVKTLLIKVHEIDAAGYYAARQNEIDATIAVEGLLPREETTHEFTDPPSRRVRRRFEFPKLDRPGVFVIDFIGNGLASRVVVRKGTLQYRERVGAAGHVLQVVDESGRLEPRATARVGSRTYAADPRGEIVIPFSTKGGKQTIVLQGGDRTAIHEFQHLEETYALEAPAFVARESLVSGQMARILVRPRLSVQGRPIDLSLLSEPVLSITAERSNGVPTTLEIRDPKLSSDEEFAHEIRVPDGLSTLRVSLRGRGRSVSQDKPIDLTSGVTTFNVNQIDRTPRTSFPLLSRTASGYILALLGKNGEPLSKRPVSLSLLHRDFHHAMDLALQTDERGQVRLGALERIVSVQVRGESAAWTLEESTRTYPTRIGAAAGETVRIPIQGQSRVPSELATIFELRGEVYSRDCGEHMTCGEGFLEVKGLTPGDYHVLLKPTNVMLRLTVTEGPISEGWVHGRDRSLPRDGIRPLHITGITVEDGVATVQCANLSPSARVHAYQSNFLESHRPGHALRLGESARNDEISLSLPDTIYASGRRIDDESRYILERKYATKFPGNMLARPSLLLNPFALAEANEAIGLGGGGGGQFGGRRGGRRNLRAAGGGGSGGVASDPGELATLDFLATATTVAANLRPDADGRVRVPLASLMAGQMLHVVAVDRDHTVYESVALPDRPLDRVDRRLARALDGTQHHSEHQVVEFLATGGRWTLEDADAAEFEVYDTVAKVYDLYRTLTQSQELAKFEFITRWNRLDDKEKRTLYSEHACHELHFFLHERDPEFFKDVVRPYLANKSRRTFLDQWLLEEDLAGHLDPKAFSRLNIVERILLTHRLDRGAAGARQVHELAEIVPKDLAWARELFETALQTDSLAGKKAPVSEDPAAAPSSAAAPSPSPKPGAAEKARDGRDRADTANQPAEADAKEAGEEMEAEIEDHNETEDRLKDVQRRQSEAQLYRAPDATRRYAENDYWHRGLLDQGADLVTVNGFWEDFADTGPNRPFHSGRFPEASRNFTEMMFALSVLDLPFEAGAHALTADGKRLTLTAASPLLVVRKEIATTNSPSTSDGLLVRQVLYRWDDPYRFENGKRYDRAVTGELLSGVAYGCRVVVTNPSESPRTLALLLQIPAGALPIDNGFETRSTTVEVAPFGTIATSYGFYMPATGSFAHYPVQVAESGVAVGAASPGRLEVVATPSSVDVTSWDHVSQEGTAEQVLKFLDLANLRRIDLTRMAWRLRDRSFFDRTIALLRDRQIFDSVVWSYALLHRDERAAREYLRTADAHLARCGPYLESALLSIDPVERLEYQHIEYAPLFNARAHDFGRQRTIPNLDLAAQYQRLMGILAYRPKLDDTDWMSVTYYLLLQDRIEDAIESFRRVDARRLPTRIQYDYMAAYLDFYSDEHALARRIANEYQNHPVTRWRSLFGEVAAQLDQAAGQAVTVSDPEDRTQTQTELASRDPSLAVTVEGRRVTLESKNLRSCEVCLFAMDVEFLFSTSPFVQNAEGTVAYVRPHRVIPVELPDTGKPFTLDLPEEYRDSNLLVEVRAAGLVKRKMSYANSLAVHLLENYGQLEVAQATTGKRLPKVYVKVYSRDAAGTVRFHKDGYTDLRGRFDYASVSGSGLPSAKSFALLIASESEGAVIREVAAPLQ